MHFRIILILLLIFAVSGCSAKKYYEKQKPIDLSTSDAVDVTVRVLAEADEWMNSGIVVKAGFKCRVEASGRWHGGPGCGWTGPDGLGALQLCFFRIIPGWSISTLIARIGDKGVPFAVGNEYTFVASHDGILQFRINDPSPYTIDNQGFVTVKVSIPRVKQDVDIIEVKIIGYDDGRKTSKQRDYREAVVNAKRQAIERAGVEVQSQSRVKNFNLEEDYIETQAKGVLLPGFEITDIGYTEGGTYNVILTGKIKASSTSKNK